MRDTEYRCDQHPDIGWLRDREWGDHVRDTHPKDGNGQNNGTAQTRPAPLPTEPKSR